MTELIHCPKCGTSFALHGTAQVNYVPPTIAETRDNPAATGEVRMFEAQEVRVERGADGKPTKLVGYAAVFNSLSNPLTTKAGKRFLEKIQPGAFKKSLESNRDIMMFRNHDQNTVLARRSAGTLKLKEDDKGLRFEATLPDTTAARDVAADVEHGNMRGVSFGFNNAVDRWEKQGEENIRTLEDLDLGEVSPVYFPAYNATQIDVRADEAIARLEAGETDVRGHVPGYSAVRSMAQSCRSMCRSAHENVHDMHEMLRDMDGSMNDAETRAVKHMYEEAGRLRSKLGELRAHVRNQILLDDVDEDGDTDDPGDPANEQDTPPEGDQAVGHDAPDDLRARLAIQRAAEEGVKTADMRAALKPVNETTAA